MKSVLSLCCVLFVASVCFAQGGPPPCQQDAYTAKDNAGSAQYDAGNAMYWTIIAQVGAESAVDDVLNCSAIPQATKLGVEIDLSQADLKFAGGDNADLSGDTYYSQGEAYLANENYCSAKDSFNAAKTKYDQAKGLYNQATTMYNTLIADCENLLQQYNCQSQQRQALLAAD